jgi:hypothetical protein
MQRKHITPSMSKRYPNDGVDTASRCSRLFKNASYLKNECAKPHAVGPASSRELCGLDHPIATLLDLAQLHRRLPVGKCWSPQMLAMLALTAN